MTAAIIELEEVRAVLDLAPVPGFLDRFALLLSKLVLGGLPFEDLGLVVLDTAGEEGSGTVCRARWEGRLKGSSGP
jgi:hypothetical protein